MRLYIVEFKSEGVNYKLEIEAKDLFAAARTVMEMWEGAEIISMKAK